MTEIVDLAELRDSLRAGLPAPMATCSPDGTPRLSYISRVQYLDADRVATSRQFFNHAVVNLEESPFAQALISQPGTGEQFRIDLQYLHTVTEGEEFEALRANLDAIASQSGIASDSVFRLRGLDVHRVLRCTRVSPRRVPAAPARDYLEPLEQLAGRLERATTYEDAATAVLEALDDLFDFRYAVLLAFDPPTARLFVVGGSGEAH
ncbi:MAG: adenylate cyclase, partial [Solirubrobacteraceae bacterium]|nr:adenylate cyclase [Solirubrobacteraceae bacterium]